MRRLAGYSHLVLLAVLGGALPAVAQQAGGWVDPPAKPAPGKATPAEAPKAAAEKTEGTRSPAVRTERPAAHTTPARRAAEAAPPEGHRGRLRFSRRDRGEAHRRMAPPLVVPVPVPAEAPASDPRFADWAVTTQQVATDYLRTVSSGNDTFVGAAPRFYAPQVRFHGRTMTLAAIMAEKRRFGRRWPERRYEPQERAMRTACHAASATCIVRVPVEFTASNPARGARSSGVAELTLTVSFAEGRPLIVGESSRVLRRYGPTLSGLAPGRGA
ncbi:hypothetical protein [Methylobacterium organophilum]|uniref:Nuclear transport factor 2 family protein n=1 Tax=Methylobacterium organophilum TaxID=410 RepID=A0ABQ4T3F6_METOR|nr:hypothetical protein [Methylobacterium organophilum]GJE25511.1 hypothetical protein LKMONMHP_0349 [Methylobacterium organophilum]